jgi:hypothetical protein
MRSLSLFFLGIILSMNLSGCKEEYKTSPSPGINVVVQDVPCEEVLQGIIKACQNQNQPWTWLDQPQGRLNIGPVSDNALPPDLDKQTEERARLDIKCLDSLSTRISLELEVRLVTPDQKWKTVTEPEALQAYGKRFLDRLLKY